MVFHLKNHTELILLNMSKIKTIHYLLYLNLKSYHNINKNFTYSVFFFKFKNGQLFIKLTNITCN